MKMGSSRPGTRHAVTDGRTCREDGCNASLAGAHHRRRICDEHQGKRARRERLCRECNGSLAGAPGAQKTCNVCKAKVVAPTPVERERDDQRPPSAPYPAHEGFDALGFLLNVRGRQRQAMAEARERMRVS